MNKRPLKNHYSVIPAEEPESNNLYLINEILDPRIKCGAGKSGMKSGGFYKSGGFCTRLKELVFQRF